MSAFELVGDEIALPKGAWAKTHRRSLRWRGRDILAFTQGSHRPYLYPVYTPAGFAVTTESPADHPHHNSVWAGADHVHAYVSAAGGQETYTYNFYVNETFQGRAPGRILQVGAASSEEVAADRLRTLRELNWIGPPEWAAEDGRVVLHERRSLEIRPGETAHVLDLTSELTTGEWEVSIGPTRHAYFNFRVAESMRVVCGGTLMDSEGRSGGRAISGAGARWVDYSGPVGGGHLAGFALMADPAWEEIGWLAADWGTVTLQPFLTNAQVIQPGERVAMRARFVVHDGDAEAADLPALYEQFCRELE